MRILLDHNVDRRFRHHLTDHEVRTTREMGWEELANGKLLRAAADNGFEAFVSVDKKLRYEQNLNTLPLPVLVLDSVSNALPMLAPFAPHLLSLLGRGEVGRFLYVIARDGTAARHGVPDSAGPGTPPDPSR